MMWAIAPQQGQKHRVELSAGGAVHHLHIHSNSV